MHWNPCSYIVQVTQSGQQHWPIGNDMRSFSNKKKRKTNDSFRMFTFSHVGPSALISKKFKASKHQIQKCRNCVEPISILEKPYSFFYQKWEPEIQTFSPTCSCSASPEVVLPPKLQVADMGRPAPPKDVVAETSIRSLGYIVVHVDG